MVGVAEDVVVVEGAVHVGGGDGNVVVVGAGCVVGGGDGVVVGGAVGGGAVVGAAVVADAEVPDVEGAATVGGCDALPAGDGDDDGALRGGVDEPSASVPGSAVVAWGAGVGAVAGALPAPFLGSAFSASSREVMVVGGGSERSAWVRAACFSEAGSELYQRTNGLSVVVVTAGAP